MKEAVFRLLLREKVQAVGKILNDIIDVLSVNVVFVKKLAKLLDLFALFGYVGVFCGDFVSEEYPYSV